ncbi:tyrosyl-DNA phosphodiesterase [Coccomyxa subellipsoidea C-169]|uniref:Tyrosyl-DNA phosphodiesterase n=1 Tax=Coccomyxa subellipsoidea (strain C-169) TaxID=574566 RepID=I0Z562_COCSC|nr:tyrosyl-DNA phosphodiesterase [Coccomyxa subellipsoidea C-169]EIE25781.1 tyrosyl-DNA phosphodiesterase [Coccomyxa subellipsoidea C-169]|eukprot:XP_005650325.1 tyrosyl-DNA phosphodiesterase [Coccomyxa subellipsoidea C-169]
MIPPVASLLRVRGLPEQFSRGALGTQLKDLLSGGPMRWLLISNFMIDMRWFVSAAPSVLDADRVTVVHGEKSNPTSVSWMQQIAAGRPWVIHQARCPLQYGVHHSKAFLVQFDRGLRVVVHTANLIHQDCNCKTQGLWYQDFPRKDERSPQDNASRLFETTLSDYIAALRLPAREAQHAQQVIAQHDFSSARAHLIPSVPGYHQGAAKQKYGHMLVRSLLARQRFDPVFRRSPIVAQFSSLGSITGAWLSEFRESLAAGDCWDSNPSGSAGRLGPAADFRVVWPTVEEVKNSVEGWFAGCSIPGTHANVLKTDKGLSTPILQPFWCRFDGAPATAGRQHAMPHIKSYLRHSGQRLAYIVLTSHNLSKAAWGVLQKNNTQLHIMHYELGVLLLPSLEESYRRHRHFGFSCTAPASHKPAAAAQPSRVEFWAADGAAAGSSEALSTGAEKLEILLPYQLPPVRYGPQDQPWMTGVEFPGLDSQGLTIHQSFDRNSHYGHVEPDD